MPGMDMTLMAATMLVGVLLLGASVLAAAYVGLRALTGGGSTSSDDSPRELLDRRLVMGEISTDEYYERESALRNAEPISPRRRQRSV